MRVCGRECVCACVSSACAVPACVCARARARRLARVGPKTPAPAARLLYRHRRHPSVGRCVTAMPLDRQRSRHKPPFGRAAVRRPGPPARQRPRSAGPRPRLFARARSRGRLLFEMRSGPIFLSCLCAVRACPRSPPLRLHCEHCLSARVPASLPPAGGRCTPDLQRWPDTHSPRCGARPSGAARRALERARTRPVASAARAAAGRPAVLPGRRASGFHKPRSATPARVRCVCVCVSPVCACCGT